MKRIVVCCDGTWNDPSKPKQTNVSKLKDAVIARGPGDADTKQRVHYVDGVGAKGSLWDRLRGGAVGFGLDENVQKAYAFVARDYVPGDEIFLFGFSRGTYTARSALGMMRKCGILKQVSEAAIRAAWDHYRDDLHPEDAQSKQWRRDNALLTAPPDDYVPIAKFIGVWDTVGSLGVPIKPLRKQYDFHDVTLTSFVDNPITPSRSTSNARTTNRLSGPRARRRPSRRVRSRISSSVGSQASTAMSAVAPLTRVATLNQTIASHGSSTKQAPLGSLSTATRSIGTVRLRVSFPGFTLTTESSSSSSGSCASRPGARSARASAKARSATAARPTRWWTTRLAAASRKTPSTTRSNSSPGS